MTSTWPRTTFHLSMLVLALLIVLHWKIGPILMSVDGPGAIGRHGLHTGDALALLPALLALPTRRLRIDRRLGIKAPLAPNPMRRATDRAQTHDGPAPERGPGRRAGESG